jgi:hypothetical protein
VGTCGPCQVGIRRQRVRSRAGARRSQGGQTAPQTAPFPLDNHPAWQEHRGSAGATDPVSRKGGRVRSHTQQLGRGQGPGIPRHRRQQSGRRRAKQYRPGGGVGSEKEEEGRMKEEEGRVKEEAEVEYLFSSLYTSAGSRDANRGDKCGVARTRRFREGGRGFSCAARLGGSGRDPRA